MKVSWLRLAWARTVSRVVTLVLGVAVFGPASAQLPAGASPGGALPRIEQPAERDLTPPPIAFSIPPAVERPLAQDEGQRLFVKRFHLDGVTDRPQTGIDAKELEALVEELRVQRQGLDQGDESGFTAEERGEIATFMREVINTPDLDYFGSEYEALVDRLRELKAERDAGMTVGQMQQIANTVTEVLPQRRLRACSGLHSGSGSR